MSKEKISLVLGGGGTKSTFGVGVVKYLLEKYEIEAVAGTSAGSINGAMISTGNFDVLLEFWNNTELLKKIFLKSYPFGIVQGALFENSLYDSSGIKNFLKSILKEDDFKKANYACVYTDAIKAKKVSKYSKDCDYENIIDSIVASSSLVPAYKPIKIDGTIGIDGGYTEGVPVETILPMVKESKKIFILLVDSSGTDTDGNVDESKNLLSSIFRALGICIDSVFDYNVKYAKAKYWDSNKKYVVVSPPKVIVKDSLDFDGERIKQSIAAGYDYAKNMGF